MEWFLTCLACLVLFEEIALKGAQLFLQIGVIIVKDMGWENAFC